jgi:cytochrome c oxidase assembly factor CtaG
MTTQQFLHSAWSWDPAVIALCVLALLAYARFAHFRFSGRSVYLLAAVGVFFIALASPIAALADGYLFSAHMLQHLLLQLVVPPLVLLSLPEGGRPKAEIRRPKEGRNPKSELPDGAAANALGAAAAGADSASTAPAASGSSESPSEFGLRNSAFFRPSDFGLRVSALFLLPIRAILSRPLLTWFLGLGAMWIWHVPTLCSASATSTPVHVVQCVSLLLLGTAFWWPIIGPWRSQWLSPLLGVLYLFSACVGCTILGIILTFAPLGVCPVFMHPADHLGILPLLRDGWGLDPARDQQLGGLLMWVPPCFVYLCGIFGMLARWYSGPDPELAIPVSTAPEPEPAGLLPGSPHRKEA